MTLNTLGNPSSTGAIRTVGGVDVPLKRYPLSGRSAVNSRLQRADVLRATRDYEASLRLGSSAAAKQMQINALKRLEKLGGKLNSDPLSGANSFRSQSSSRNIAGNQPPRLLNGLFK